MKNIIVVLSLLLASPTVFGAKSQTVLVRQSVEFRLQPGSDHYSWLGYLEKVSTSMGQEKTVSHFEGKSIITLEYYPKIYQEVAPKQEEISAANFSVFGFCYPSGGYESQFLDVKVFRDGNASEKDQERAEAECEKFNPKLSFSLTKDRLKGTIEADANDVRWTEVNTFSLTKEQTAKMLEVYLNGQVRMAGQYEIAVANVSTALGNKEANSPESVQKALESMRVKNIQISSPLTCSTYIGENWICKASYSYQVRK